MHAADVELAAGDDAEELVVTDVEEIETGIRPALATERLRELVQFVAAVARILESRQELQVAAVLRIRVAA